MKSLSLSQFLFCNKKIFFSKLLGSIGSLCPLFPAMVETHGWLCWGVCIQWAWGAQLSTPPHPHPSSTRQIHGPSPSLPVGGPPLNHFVAPCTPLGGLTVGPPDDFCSSNCPTLSLPTGNLRFPRCPSRDYQKLGLLSTRQGRGIFAAPPSLSGLLCHMLSATRGTPGGLLSAPPGARSLPAPLSFILTGLFLTPGLSAPSSPPQRPL